MRSAERPKRETEKERQRKRDRERQMKKKKDNKESIKEDEPTFSEVVWNSLLKFIFYYQNSFFRPKKRDETAHLEKLLHTP